MLEVAEKLVASIKAGEVSSVAVMVEYYGDARPALAMRGLWARDHHRAAVAVQYAAAKLQRRLLTQDSAPAIV